MTYNRRNRMLLLLAGGVVLAAIIVLIIARSGGPAQGGRQPSKVTFITVQTPTMVFYPLVVAQELGLFGANNVKPTINVASEGVAGTTYLSNGNADLAFTDADKIILANVKGGDFQSIYSPQWQNTIGVVAPQRGSVRSFSDLRGKTVGFASSENLPLFKALLAKATIPSAQVKTAVVGSSGALLVNAFKSGKIDAYVGGITDFVRISANGYPLRDVTPAFYDAIDGNPIAVSPKTLQAKRKAIVSFLRAFAEAQYLGYTRPNVVKAIVRRRIPLEWTNLASAQATFKQSIQLMTQSPPNRMGDLRVGPWNTVQDLLVREGALKSRIDVTKILNRTLIAEINSFDRSAVVQRADAWMKQNK